MPLTILELHSAIAGNAAALRRRSRLQPAGGPGTKVFPPTYSGAVYATEMRRLPGHEAPVPCVLLDSVQSQANRMEEALQYALDRGDLAPAGLPVVEVDFTPYFPGDGVEESLRLRDAVGRITSLEAPHRIADAILRDSVKDGVAFRDTEEGRRLSRASAANATPLFELCPTALLFGMWDSTGPKGGLGAKVERSLVSEIVGIDAVLGTKTSSRIDPLGIQRNAGVLYQKQDGGWSLDEAEAVIKKKKPALLGKDGRPSEANHGNVTPSLSDRDREGNPLAGGTTIDHAEQSVVLSLAALRRLRFPTGDAWNPTDSAQHARDDAARTVIAALGLLAATLATQGGMDLRSRCLLWADEPPTWELLSGGGTVSTVEVTPSSALDLYQAAVRAAESEHGLAWRREPLVLAPSTQLLRLVIKSQDLTIQQGASEETEA